MKILDWLFEPFGEPVQRKSDPVTVTVPTHSPEVIRAGISASASGTEALQLSAVFACARVIAEALAQVPCLLQRRGKTGGYDPATDHPLYDLLIRAPNGFQTSFEFREWVGFQLALFGNAFVFVVRDDQGRPIELLPLAQGSVSVSSPALGEVLYRLNVSGNPIYDQSNIWHVKGASLTGLTGLNPQAIAARAIGLAADLETFGSTLFRNGSSPSGILTTASDLSPEQHAQLTAAWNAQQAGLANAHKTAVLSSGLTFQPIQTSAADAQFTEARRFQIEEVCRVMRVDPLMIMQATNSASYASVEQRFLAHLTHTVAPWFARFEQSAEVSLLSLEEQRAGYRIHLDPRGLMKASAADTANYVGLCLQNGVMTQNEGRETLGLDRVNDPAADMLRPAANLYGDTAQNSEQAK